MSEKGPAASIIAELGRRGERIAVAESLTGGLLVSALIDVPGASAVVDGGVVAYRTDLKRSVLGVDGALLAEHGAVHPEVAVQMAAGVRRALAGSEGPVAIGIATTGVAGPDTQDGKPVGTVFIAVSRGEQEVVQEHHFLGHRDQIRAAAVDAALVMLGDLFAHHAAL